MNFVDFSFNLLDYKPKKFSFWHYRNALVGLGSSNIRLCVFFLGYNSNNYLLWPKSNVTADVECFNKLFDFAHLYNNKQYFVRTPFRLKLTFQDMSFSSDQFLNNFFFSHSTLCWSLPLAVVKKLKHELKLRAIISAKKKKFLFLSLHQKFYKFRSFFFRKTIKSLNVILNSFFFLTHKLLNIEFLFFSLLDFRFFVLSIFSCSFLLFDFNISRKNTLLCFFGNNSLYSLTKINLLFWSCFFFPSKRSNTNTNTFISFHSTFFRYEPRRFFSYFIKKSKKGIDNQKTLSEIIADNDLFVRNKCSKIYKDNYAIKRGTFGVRGYLPGTGEAITDAFVLKLLKSFYEPVSDLKSDNTSANIASSNSKENRNTSANIASSNSKENQNTSANITSSNSKENQNTSANITSSNSKENRNNNQKLDAATNASKLKKKKPLLKLKLVEPKVPPTKEFIYTATDEEPKKKRPPLPLPEPEYYYQSKRLPHDTTFTYFIPDLTYTKSFYNMKIVNAPWHPSNFRKPKAKILKPLIKEKKPIDISIFSEIEQNRILEKRNLRSINQQNLAIFYNENIVKFKSDEKNLPLKANHLEILDSNFLEAFYANKADRSILHEYKRMRVELEFTVAVLDDKRISQLDNDFDVFFQDPFNNRRLHKIVAKETNSTSIVALLKDADVLLDNLQVGTVSDSTIESGSLYVCDHDFVSNADNDYFLRVKGNSNPDSKIYSDEEKKKIRADISAENLLKTNLKYKNLFNKFSKEHALVAKNEENARITAHNTGWLNTLQTFVNDARLPLRKRCPYGVFFSKIKHPKDLGTKPEFSSFVRFYVPSFEFANANDLKNLGASTNKPISLLFRQEDLRRLYSNSLVAANDKANDFFRTRFIWRNLLTHCVSTGLIRRRDVCGITVPNYRELMRLRAIAPLMKKSSLEWITAFNTGYIPSPLDLNKNYLTFNCTPFEQVKDQPSYWDLLPFHRLASYNFQRSAHIAFNSKNITFSWDDPERDFPDDWQWQREWITTIDIFTPIKCPVMRTIPWPKPGVVPELINDWTMCHLYFDTNHFCVINRKLSDSEFKNWIVFKDYYLANIKLICGITSSEDFVIAHNIGVEFGTSSDMVTLLNNLQAEVNEYCADIRRKRLKRNPKTKLVSPHLHPDDKYPTQEEIDAFIPDYKPFISFKPNDFFIEKFGFDLMSLLHFIAIEKATELWPEVYDIKNVDNVADFTKPFIPSRDIFLLDSSKILIAGDVDFLSVYDFFFFLRYYLTKTVYVDGEIEWTWEPSIPRIARGLDKYLPSLKKLCKIKSKKNAKKRIMNYLNLYKEYTTPDYNDILDNISCLFSYSEVEGLAFFRNIDYYFIRNALYASGLSIDFLFYEKHIETRIFFDLKNHCKKMLSVEDMLGWGTFFSIVSDLQNICNYYLDYLDEKKPKPSSPFCYICVMKNHNIKYTHILENGKLTSTSTQPDYIPDPNITVDMLLQNPKNTFVFDERLFPFFSFSDSEIKKILENFIYISTLFKKKALRVLKYLSLSNFDVDNYDHMEKLKNFLFSEDNDSTIFYEDKKLFDLKSKMFQFIIKGISDTAFCMSNPFNLNRTDSNKILELSSFLKSFMAVIRDYRLTELKLYRQKLALDLKKNTENISVKGTKKKSKKKSKKKPTEVFKDIYVKTYKSPVEHNKPLFEEYIKANVSYLDSFLKNSKKDTKDI